MSNTPVYVTDMGAAAAAGGIRINDQVIIHDGLSVDEQGALLAELLHPGETPMFLSMTATPLATARSA